MTFEIQGKTDGFVRLRKDENGVEFLGRVDVIKLLFWHSIKAYLLQNLAQHSSFGIAMLF